MRGNQVKLFLSQGMFAACPSFMDGIVATVNSEDGISAVETINDVTPAHSYAVDNGVAVISIDGAMTKRNTWMNAMCSGFTSYDILAQYIDKAENDPSVHTIVFNVDTPGGEVAGADSVGEQIYACTKKTITFYNNLGASAGIWIFSAANEIYANETAMIGSIGVLAGYNSEPDNSGVVTMVSKNAKNKNCALNGDCAEKIQSRIDQIEEIFYARVTRNTGLSANDIATKFGFGSVISAADAKAAGFVKEITTLPALIKSVKGATMPASGVSTTVKIASKSDKGSPMELSQENFEALQARNAELTQQLTALQASAAEGVTALEATVSDLAQLRAEHDAMVAGNAVAQEELATRIREGIECGVNADTLIAMVSASTAAEASVLALRFQASTGGTAQADSQMTVSKEEAEIAFAKELAKTLSV